MNFSVSGACRMIEFNPSSGKALFEVQMADPLQVAETCAKSLADSFKHNGELARANADLKLRVETLEKEKEAREKECKRLEERLRDGVKVVSTVKDKVDVVGLPKNIETSIKKLATNKD